MLGHWLNLIERQTIKPDDRASVTIAAAELYRREDRYNLTPGISLNPHQLSQFTEKSKVRDCFCYVIEKRKRIILASHNKKSHRGFGSKYVCDTCICWRAECGVQDEISGVMLDFARRLTGSTPKM